MVGKFRYSVKQLPGASNWLVLKCEQMCDVGPFCLVENLLNIHADVLWVGKGMGNAKRGIRVNINCWIDDFVFCDQATATLKNMKKQLILIEKETIPYCVRKNAMNGIKKLNEFLGVFFSLKKTLLNSVY